MNAIHALSQLSYAPATRSPRRMGAAQHGKLASGADLRQVSRVALARGPGPAHYFASMAKKKDSAPEGAPKRAPQRPTKRPPDTGPPITADMSTAEILAASAPARPRRSRKP